MRENIYGPENRVTAARVGGVRNVIFSGSGLYRGRHNASFTAGASANWYEQVPRVRSADDEALLSLRLASTPEASTAAGAVFDKVVGACVFPTVKEWTEKGTIAEIPNDVYRCFCLYFLPKMGRLGKRREDGVPMTYRVYVDTWMTGVLPAYVSSETPPSWYKTITGINGTVWYSNTETGYEGGYTPYYGPADVGNMVSYARHIAPCSFYYDTDEGDFFIEGAEIVSDVVALTPATYSSDGSWRQTSHTGEVSGSDTDEKQSFITPELASKLHIVRQKTELEQLTYIAPITVDIANFSVEDILSGSADIPCVCTFRAFGSSVSFPATYEYRGGNDSLHIPCFSPLPDSERDLITSCASSPISYGFCYTAYALWWRNYFCKNVKTPMGLVYVPEGRITLDKYVTKHFVKKTAEVSGAVRKVRVCTRFVADLFALVPTIAAASPLLNMTTMDYASASTQFMLGSSYDNTTESRAALLNTILCEDMVPSWITPSSVYRRDTSILSIVAEDLPVFDFSEATVVLSTAVMEGGRIDAGNASSAPYTAKLPGQTWTSGGVHDQVDADMLTAVNMYNFFTEVLSRQGVVGDNFYHENSVRTYPSVLSHTFTEKYSLSATYNTGTVVHSEIRGYRVLGYSHDTDRVSVFGFYTFPAFFPYASVPLLECGVRSVNAEGATETVYESWHVNGDLSSVSNVEYSRARTHSHPAVSVKYLLVPFNKPASIASGAVVTTPTATYPTTVSRNYTSLEDETDVDSGCRLYSADVSLRYMEVGYTVEAAVVGEVTATTGRYDGYKVTADIHMNGEYVGDVDIRASSTPSTISGSEWCLGLTGEQLGAVRTFGGGRGLVSQPYGVVLDGETVLRRTTAFSFDQELPPGYSALAGFYVDEVHVADANANHVTYGTILRLPTSLIEAGVQTRVFLYGEGGLIDSYCIIDSYDVVPDANGQKGRAVSFDVTLGTERATPDAVVYACIVDTVSHACSLWFELPRAYVPSLRGAVVHRLTVEATSAHYVTRRPYEHDVTNDYTVYRATSYAPDRHVYPNIGMMQPTVEDVYDELGEAKYSVVQGFSAIAGGKGYVVFATPVLATEALFSQKGLLSSTSYSTVIASLESAAASAATVDATTTLQAVRTRITATATEEETEGADMAPTRVYEAFLYVFSEMVVVLLNDFASVELMFLMSENRQSFALLPISAKLPSTDSLVKILS